MCWCCSVGVTDYCRISKFATSRISRFQILATYESVDTLHHSSPWHSTIKHVPFIINHQQRHKSQHNKHKMMSSIPASNIHGFRSSSPALVQSVYPATTTVVQPVAQPRYAVYDKPADRRLRPWILLGSVLLGVCSLLSILPLPSPHKPYIITHSITHTHTLTHSHTHTLTHSHTHTLTHSHSPTHSLSAQSQHITHPLLSVHGSSNDHPHIRRWRQNQLTLGSLCCWLPSWWCCNPWIHHWIYSSSRSKGTSMSPLLTISCYHLSLSLSLSTLSLSLLSLHSLLSPLPNIN